ncbi:MAG: Crp/Fnr family transcriptional regulator [Caldilineaceae bacterium]|nr:Crp/Fnr family transcriptional regulator [Caldilineaceae bacterium]
MARPTTPLSSKEIKPEMCSHGVQRTMLRRTPFFSGLSLTEIEKVHALTRVQGYVSDEFIFMAGAPATRLYVIAAGKVKVLQPALSGQEVVLDILTGGEFFGGLPLLGDETYTETAQALTSCCILEIRAEVFQEILQQYPSVALKTLELVGNRLKNAHKSIHQLSARPVEARIAALLLYLAAKVGEEQKGELLLQVPLSRQDLAAMTGTTPESASRVISQFKKQGLVSSGRQWIALIDQPALAEIAEGDL